MAIVKLSSLEKRKVSIFIVCLTCAILAWLFFALFNKTFIVYNRVLAFKNLPLNKAFYPLQSDSILVKVETNGWEALFLGKRKPKKNNFEVDLKLLGDKNYIVFSENALLIKKNTLRNQKIISIKPDTLFFDFTKRKIKQIPVKVISQLSFQKQFNQSGPIDIYPKMVTIIGPELEINKIKYWPTQMLKTNKSRAKINLNVSLPKLFKNNINVYPMVVNVKIPVEEFTEKQLEIPITIYNNPNYYSVKLFPNKVIIKVMVSLSQYNKITAENFEAKVDLDLWTKYKAEKLSVELINKAPFTYVFQIEPHQLNYIIKK